jgi:hypothetical protein
MRDELFRYRKRKKVSLDGSIAGAPYNSFRRSRRHVSGMPHRSGSPGYHHGSYTPGNPRGYRPSLNAPSVDWDEYDSYKPAEMHHVPAKNNTRTPHSFGSDNQQVPGLMPVPQDDLTLLNCQLMLSTKMILRFMTLI